MKIDTQTLPVSKKQLIAIAAIILTGVILGSMILGSKASKHDSGHDSHASHESHASASADNHGHGSASGKPATQAQPQNHDAEHGKNHAQEKEHGQEKDHRPAQDHGQEKPHGPDKITLSEAQIKAAAITIGNAGAARIKSTLSLPGEIRLNEDKTSHVVPRVPGIVESVPASLGQLVKQGQVLAVIASPGAADLRSQLQTAQKRLALTKTTLEREKRLWEQKISAEQDFLQAGQAHHEAEVALANAAQKLSALGLDVGSPQRLSRYELRAPSSGLVIEKHAGLGEAVKEDTAVFTISDLAQVWAEINVPARDLPLIQVGTTVTIRASAFDASATGTVTFVGALIGEQTRMAKARVVLANPARAWRPGLFVTVEVQSSAAELAVPVSVASEAIQTLGTQPVVFLKVDGGFIAQPVQVGRSDGTHTEIRHGIQPGAAYAAVGSFVLKSELGKASAEHSH